jgi:uncharacterized repeat protein (TIGR02543 family)
MKKIMKISLVLAVAMLISVMAVATVSATSDMNEKTNTGITIDSKEKKVTSYKITWNANGGKIGSKKTKITSVKRGSKIGKLVAASKRSKYSFKGWFTKKSEGKKITKNTKVTKKVTFFAQWKKKTKVLNAAEKKLVGIWSRIRSGGGSFYNFNSDGTFGNLARIQIGNFAATSYYWEGVWHVTGGSIYMTTLRAQVCRDSRELRAGEVWEKAGTWEPYSLNNPNNKFNNYKIGIDERGEYLQIDDNGPYYKNN